MKMLFVNGEYYEGNMKSNMRNSTGIHYYLNGDHYDGEWTNDRRVGRGRIFLANKNGKPVMGGKINGRFQEDCADGSVEFEDEFGNMIQTENEEAKSSAPNKKVQKSSAVVYQPGSFRNGKLYK